jgi:hypothetical protein
MLHGFRTTQTFTLAGEKNYVGDGKRRWLLSAEDVGKTELAKIWYCETALPLQRYFEEEVHSRNVVIADGGFVKARAVAVSN